MFWVLISKTLQKYLKNKKELSTFGLKLMVRYSFLVRCKWKANQFSFLKMQLKTSFYDKLYYASERMHHSKGAKQYNKKGLWKQLYF